MKKLITTIRNIFSIEDLRIRILNTIGLLVIFRLGSFVVLPGIDPVILSDVASAAPSDGKNIWDFINTFLGGAFSRASIFALGIMPYISASIVVQLMTVAVPYFQKLQKDGESGRKKINQITRVLTIAITAAQGFSYVLAAIPNEAISEITPFWRLSSVFILISGTMFCMWIGERITDKGIGNGISMLIMIGIISRLPGSLIAEAQLKGIPGALQFVLELVALFFIVVGVVGLTQAVRKIPIQYAKQVVGSKLYGSKRDYLPLKLNSAGVMPIIFAQALMFIPSMLAGLFRENSDIANYIGTAFADPYGWQYNVLFGFLILVFTFFYTAITVNPNEIADNLKKNGGFIPGVKPGKKTSEYLDNILSRITLPGSIFLGFIAIMPAFAMLAGVNSGFAHFYGGTSLLILVGVVLDTLQQIESYLLMRHYDGLTKSGRMKGRSSFSM